MTKNSTNGIQSGTKLTVNVVQTECKGTGNEYVVSKIPAPSREGAMSTYGCWFEFRILLGTYCCGRTASGSQVCDMDERVGEQKHVGHKERRCGYAGGAMRQGDCAAGSVHS